MSYSDVVSQFLSYFETAQSLDTTSPVIPNLSNIVQVSSIQDTLQASKAYYSNILQQGYFSTPASSAISSILVEVKAALDTLTKFSSSNIPLDIQPVETVNNLLLSFGFTLLNLPYYTKQAILTNIVSNYKIKGTMQSVFNMVQDITNVPIMIAELYFKKWFESSLPEWKFSVQQFPSCLISCLSVLGVKPQIENSLIYPNTFNSLDATKVILNSSNYLNNTSLQIASTNTSNVIDLNFSPKYYNVEFYNMVDNKLSRICSDSFTNIDYLNNEYLNNYSMYCVTLEPDYIYYSDSSKSIYTINHNLESPYISLTCYDVTDNVLISPNVTILDNNNIYLDSGTTNQIVVCINGMNTVPYYLYQSNSTMSSYTVIHNLNQQYPDVTCYDNNSNMICPSEVMSLDNNSLYIQFDNPVKANILVLMSLLEYEANNNPNSTIYMISEIENIDNSSQYVTFPSSKSPILAFSYYEPYTIPGSNGYIEMFLNYNEVVDKNWMMTVNYLINSYPYGKAMSPYFILKLMMNQSNYLFATTILKQYAYLNYLTYQIYGNYDPNYLSTRTLISQYLPDSYNYLEGYFMARYLWCIMNNVSNDNIVNYSTNST